MSFGISNGIKYAINLRKGNKDKWSLKMNFQVKFLLIMNNTNQNEFILLKNHNLYLINFFFFENKAYDL